MINFDKCSLNELYQIRDIVTDNKLHHELDSLIRKKSLSDYSIQSQYRSDRLPDFKKEYMSKCQQLLLEFDVWSLEFLWKAACFDYKNNKQDFSGGVFSLSKDALDEKWRGNLGYLSMIFQDKEMQQKYEGVYNTLNFITNGVYRNLDKCHGNITGVDYLFIDFENRKEIVKENFTDVVEYLWQTREAIPGARLSVSNHGLTKNREKLAKGFSHPQRALIEAVAFGCSLSELEREDYAAAKRLIYVPCGKIITK